MEYIRIFPHNASEKLISPDGDIKYVTQNNTKKLDTISVCK